MEESETCADCAYYRDAINRQASNGLIHLIGVCVFEVFQADTFDELAKAALVEVDTSDEPCEDFRKAGD